jgi:hypothetical protein
MARLKVGDVLTIPVTGTTTARARAWITRASGHPTMRRGHEPSSKIWCRASRSRTQDSQSADPSQRATSAL